MLQLKARNFFSILAVLVILGTALLNVTPAFAGNGTAEYVVKSGDNLTEIAKRFGLTVEKIMAVNPEIKDSNALLTGQTIILPAGRSEGVTTVDQKGRYYRWQLEKDGKTISKDEHFYLVKSGDTLERIAKAYGVSLERLLQENPQIEDSTKLYRQELVRIPNGRAENVPPFYFTPPANTSK